MFNLKKGVMSAFGQKADVPVPRKSAFRYQWLFNGE